MSAVIFIIFNGYGWSYTVTTCLTLRSSQAAFALDSFFTFSTIFNSNFLNKFVYALSINTVSIVIKIESEVICITDFILINTWFYCID
ncbi:Uncharacterised protein [Streptococcus pneumoniae]|nr:Uncharacterised protein [Streptococcus pneumoniae]